jgi:hypothetical protein
MVDFLVEQTYLAAEEIKRSDDERGVGVATSSVTRH